MNIIILQQIKKQPKLGNTKTFYTIWKGIAEQLKHVANTYGLEVIFTRSLSLKSKLPTNPFKRCSACGIVCKVTYSCYKKYIGEPGRTIEEMIKEHQADVKKVQTKQQVYHNISEKLDIHLLGKKYK